MGKENIDFSLKRLEKIKQATILKFLETVDLDSIMGFYDSMVDHVFKGDLDQDFLSKTLMGLDDEEKGEIFQLARRYKVVKAPTLIVPNGSTYTVYENASNIKGFIEGLKQ